MIRVRNRGAEPGAPGHVQSEYMLPRVRATEAIAKLRGIGAKVDEHLLVSAIRSVAVNATVSDIAAYLRISARSFLIFNSSKCANGHFSPN